MNKKGFTLVEILGVIIIIISLGLLVIPNIMNRFSNKKVEVNATKEQVVLSSARLYVSDHEEQYSTSNSMYCLNMDDLVKGGYLDKKITEDNSVKDKVIKINNNNKLSYKLVDECKTEYAVGDKIKVAGEYYYVIADSPNEQDYVTALKEYPLTVDEVNLYGGVGTENNHVNRYIIDNAESAFNDNNTGYGRMAYFGSPTCGYNGSSWVKNGCTTSYDSSDIKYVVDAWAQMKFTNKELKTVDGYGARLITIEELQPIGWPSCNLSNEWCDVESITPQWIYTKNIWYWTSSQWNDLEYVVWCVGHGGQLYRGSVDTSMGLGGVARPVINVYKSAIED